ncbi:MAG: hypothetical protein PHO26_00910 [Dehalococcoidia bacterium]|nr:hypothetical protein [Dehalococcoidia bacterium]MDD5493767.1 hypothetical protein [Dehalococcoidia bacterium]
MRRIFGTLVALVVAVSLVLIPATVSADLGKCTGWDKVKWENNQNSWKLYLQHWGRTPISAMSRLAGLCGPDKLCPGVTNMTKCPKPTGCDVNACLGGCSNCNTESGSLGTACTDSQKCLNPKDKPTSLPMDDCPLNCPTNTITQGLGTAKCAAGWGKSLSFANKSWAPADLGKNSLINNKQLNHMGGDWGITGSPHPECAAQTWALQNNLLAKCKICK